MRLLNQYWHFLVLLLASASEWSVWSLVTFSWQSWWFITLFLRNKTLRTVFFWNFTPVSSFSCLCLISAVTIIFTNLWWVSSFAFWSIFAIAILIFSANFVAINITYSHVHIVIIIVTVIGILRIIWLIIGVWILLGRYCQWIRIWHSWYSDLTMLCYFVFFLFIHSFWFVVVYWYLSI